MRTRGRRGGAGGTERGRGGQREAGEEIEGELVSRERDCAREERERKRWERR